MRKLTLLSVVGFMGVVAAACSGDDESTIDGAPPGPDACTTCGTPDAGPADASTPDAEFVDTDAAPTYGATISIQEVNINGIAALGQGLNISIGFYKNGKAPAFEEIPGDLQGCKVTEYTVAELAAELSQNAGAVQITSMDGTPVLPPCAFVPTMGYLCIADAGMAATTVTPLAMPPGGALVTITGETYTAAEVGRWVQISGAAMAGNNGRFPIVGVNAGSLVIGNPGAAAEAGFTATYTIVAGAGPIPGAADPGFLADDDALTVTLDMTGGTGEWTDFTSTFTMAGGGVGDDFSLDTASQGVISAIPVDGTAFTIDCAGAGGTCGTSLGTILTITTTDGSVAGLPPYIMPPPATKQVSIRCARIGSSAIVVPAAVGAYLMTSGATRIQATYLRTNLQQPTTSTQPVNVVAGHGTAGFTTP